MTMPNQTAKKTRLIFTCRTKEFMWSARLEKLIEDLGFFGEGWKVTLIAINTLLMHAYDYTI